MKKKVRAEPALSAINAAEHVLAQKSTLICCF